MDVRMPDGTIVTNVPDDVTQTELLRRFELSKQPEVAPETTFGGHAKEFVKGLGAGAVNLAETAGTGFSALLSDKAEKMAREQMKSGLAGAKEYLAPEKGYEDTMSRKLGEGLGSTLPFFAAAPLGAVGAVAGVATGVAAGAGEARQRAEAEGATGSERAWATALGIGPGLLDVVAPELKIGKTLITRAFLKGGVEGATEAAQQVAQNLIAKGVYNPEAAVLEGSGEAGAYGAGVGAMASTLVDLALGRKARGAKGAPKEETPAQPETVTPAGPTAPTAPIQGQLFTEEAAPAQPFSPLPTAAEAAPTPTEPGAVEPEAGAVAQEEQGQLDLSTGRTVDQQIEDLYVEEEAAKTEEELRQAEADLEKAKLQMESDITEISARVEKGEANKVEQQRLEILRTIVEQPQIPNIPKAFNRALIKIGYPKDAEFTERETNLINKAIDVQQAEADVEEITAPVDTQAQTGELEALVPAKEEARHIEQPPLPGIPKAKPSEVRAAEQAAVAPAEEAAVNDVVTQDLLDNLGVPPKAPIRTRIEGMSLADPEQAAQVRTALLELATNPNIKARLRNSISNFANSQVFRTQGEMFGPRGGIEKGAVPPTTKQVEQRKAEYAAKQEAEKQARSERAKKAAETRKAKQEAESAVTRTEPAAARVSPESTVGERGERRAAVSSAERTEAPKAPRLGDTKRVPVQPTGRAGKQQPAVTEAKKAETKAKVESNEWDQVTEKLLRTDTSGPTLAELIAAKKKGAKKLEGAAALALDLDEATTKLIKDGDISGALNRIAETTDGIASRIAKALAPLVSNVKIGIVSAAEMNKHSLDGGVVNGMYFPKQNAILLNADTLNPHTILHEAVHAATSHVLDNKSHPVTKQLQKLFEDVKDSLDTAYGAQSLDEFVAEAFSNPEFQAKLSAINPKGEAVTAWQRFTHTINNFLRRMIGMEPARLTAMDKADELISAILSPSPETRDAGSLYMKSMMGKGAEWVDSVIKGRSVLPASPNLDAYHEFFTGTLPNKVKEAIRGALPLNALVDVATKYIPMAPKVDTLVNEKSASESKRNDRLHNSIMDVSRWANKQTEAIMKAFNNTVYNSTIDQVDPSKPRDTYKGDKEQLKAWDDAQADWKAIGQEGQSMYKMMRDTYKGMYDEIQKILGIRIDESMADPATSKKIKSEIYKRLAERGGLEPYFPLTRSGKYWLSYHAFDPRTNSKELYVEAFESSRARDRAMEELKTNGAEEITKFANFKDISYKSAPPTSFANSVLKTLESNKVDPETTEQVMRLFLDTLPETSFAQAFRQRKGTLGFETDAVKAFKIKAHSISRQLSNMEYGAKLATLKREITEHVKKSGSDEATVQFADELGKRIDFAISPSVPYWSKVATSIGFNMTLGFNLSSALVNMTQIPLVTMPYLGGKYGFSETSKALGRAAKIFTNSGTDRMIETYVPTEKGETKRKVKAFWSLDNYDFSKHPELKHLQTLSDIAGNLGQLNRSQIYDVLDVDESDSLLSKVNAASGLVFHHGERMNRQVSLIAAYELELQKLVGKGKDIKSATKEQMEAAAHEAIYLTELTNGGVAAAAAPRIAQGGIGKVLFMFKRYGVSMYYMMFKTAKEALKSADPEVRKQAMKQIAGIYGSSALIAGVKGVPLFGIAAMIFNMFRDDDEDDFETATRKWMGETAFKGPVNALTGLEIAGRVGLSDLLFRDQGYNKDQTAIQSFMEMAGGPVFGVASRVERGLTLIGEGETQRGVEQMLPSAIGNGLKAVRFASEGTQTLRGDPITGEMNPWNVFAQGFGFAPAEYIQQLERNAAVKKIDRKANEQRTKLLRQYYMAIRESDISGAQDTMAEVMKFNRKHPGATITGETIKNSMAQHKKTSATMYHGITLSKNMRNELMGNIAEYDNGIDLFD